MQTGLQSFDLSIIGAPGNSRSTISGTGKPSTDAASDQLAGFMEIMSALLALPPEQWKQSLAELDTASADGSEAAVANPAGESGPQMPPAELLKLIMNMKGEVLQQLHAAKADGEPHPLLDMAETLMGDPQIAALASQETDQSQSVQGGDIETLLSQAENGVQEGLTADPGGVPGMEKGENPLVIEAAVDSGNESPAVKKEGASKAARQPDQMNDFLFKTSDAQTESAHAPNPDKPRPSLVAGFAKAPVQDNTLADEKGQPQAVGKDHQALAVDGLKDAGANAQPQVDGETLEGRFVQKPDQSASRDQGIVWRSEAVRESEGQAVSGAKQVAPQEKAEPSDIIRQIVQRMSLQTSGDQSKMVIRLKPEFLGNVHLHVLTENHQVTVRMMADSTLVKDIVEQNLPHLRAELQHHGLQIQKFDVFVANDGQGWRGGQDQAGFRDSWNQKKSRSGGGRSRHQRAKVTFDTGDEKKTVRQEAGEINYFA
jgi:flagellar hook-length control protein FliK